MNVFLKIFLLLLCSISSAVYASYDTGEEGASWRELNSQRASFKPIDLPPDAGYISINHLSISENGEMVFMKCNDNYFNMEGDKYKPRIEYYKTYNAKTDQLAELKGCHNVLGMTQEGIIVGQLFDGTGALWKEGEEEPSAIFSGYDFVDMSRDNKILGYKRSEGSSNCIVFNHKREIIERLPPFFQAREILADGKTILGFDHTNKDSHCKSAMCQNGEITRMPDGLYWGRDIHKKGSRIVGFHDNKLAEYKNGEIEYIPMAIRSIDIVKDDLMVSRSAPHSPFSESAHIWKDGFCYSIFQMLKLLGVAITEESALTIQGVSADNLNYVGLIYDSATMKMGPLAYRATLPPHMFNEKTRIHFDTH
jgi:hypothetical protein